MIQQRVSRRGLLAGGSAGLLLAGTAPLRAAPSRWEWRAPLPQPMGELVSVAVGTQIFTLAGLDDMEHVPYGAVFRYDSPSDQWTTLPNMPVPAHHIMAAGHGGNIYMFGGFTRPEGVKAWQPTANAWKYDPASGQWTAIAPLPGARGAGQAVVAGGRIFIIGGVCSNADGRPDTAIPVGSMEQTVLSSVDEYDPATDRWRPRRPMPTPRNHYLAAESGGKIYAINGRIGSVFVTSSDVTDLVEMYDPAADRWLLKTRAPTRRGDVAGASANGRIIVVGGEYQDPKRKMAFWAAESYDPAANAWQTLPHMMISRHGLGAAFIGDQFHVVGGSIQSDGMPGIDTPTVTHEMFDISAAT